MIMTMMTTMKTMMFEEGWQHRLLVLGYDYDNDDDDDVADV